MLPGLSYATLGALIVFYLGDRNRIDDRMNVLSGRISDVATVAGRNGAKIEDLWTDYRGNLGHIESELRSEKDYDREVRERLNAVAVRLHERIDDVHNRVMEILTTIVAQKMAPGDYMAVPQRRGK